MAGCSTLRKAECTASGSCKWIVGKGCRVKNASSSSSPKRKSSSKPKPKPKTKKRSQTPKKSTANKPSSIKSKANALSPTSWYNKTMERGSVQKAIQKATEYKADSNERQWFKKMQNNKAYQRAVDQASRM